MIYIPPEAFLQILLFAVIVTIPFIVLLLLTFRHMKTHPTTGTVIGKTKRTLSKKDYFILILEGKKQRETKVTTNAKKWANAQLGDTFTTDLKNGDWYWLSN